MSTLIALETEDFARAARSVYSDVADPLTAAMARITARLDDCAAMAGTDPGGRHWAGAYDRSAAATLMATQDVLNGCYRLSALFAQTARNYEAAELASTAGGRHSGAAVTIQLPDETVVSLVTSLPTAAAGAAPPPGAWGLIANLVGRVWPNGHQDRLRAAARAWRSSGDDLWLRSEYVAVAVVPALGDHLPELPDMSTVCDAMYMHLRDVAAAHRALADACAQLAGHLDEMHAAVENELISLVEWTAGVEFTGALLSVVTLGAAEAPTQAVEGARIARTAARVGAIIDRFVALAGTAAATAGAVLDRVAVVSARVRALLNVQLSAATVTWAERLRTVHISGELGAIGRLSGDAEPEVRLFADKAAAREGVKGPIRASARKFFGDATSKCRDFRVSRLVDGSSRLEFFAPANNVGYGKLYVQTVDSSGVVIAEYKDTIGPFGLIERKWIRGGPR